MREARTAQIQRDEAQLEQLRRQLGTSAPEAAANPASSPFARAEALTKALKTERQARIKDLARLLKISREAATAQVRLEDFKRMKPPPPTRPRRWRSWRSVPATRPRAGP